MDEPELSPLEEFLRAHGQDFTCDRPPAAAAIKPGSDKLSWCFAAVALVTFLAIAVPAVEILVIVAPALLLASLVLMAINSRYRQWRTSKDLAQRRGAFLTPNGVHVPPRGQSLVAALMMRNVWALDPPIPAARSQLARSDEILDSIWDEYPYLEDAAGQYNRIVADIQSSTALAPAVLRGADEAMVAIFLQLEQLSRLPEGTARRRAVLASGAEGMKNLADCVEAVVHQATPSQVGPDPRAELDRALQAIHSESERMLSSNLEPG